jgi:hypothetical protein
MIALTSFGNRSRLSHAGIEEERPILVRADPLPSLLDVGPDLLAERGGSFMN